ncbi:hypothetical protein MKW98_029468 [Papaver atlanticum]|uniref:Uncharacterized protein n=1 Tax=Papaver atlanticum TaxID=357466 RepID=A0AAD4SJ90_9MAGN|nr:hypothetical protein MKW98_029468 [Papaver atlanticum]
MVPPLPNHSIGSLIAPALVGPSNKPDEFQVNYGLISSLQDVHERFNRGELELHTITSWCRFPFYETDFGWGKPTWVCTVNAIAKNVFILMDTSDGNGVEAWVTLDEQQMSQFESDNELLEFLVTQSPAVPAGPIVLL